jgi:VCBS repeat-containing protein
LNGDTDPNGDPLTAVLEIGPAHAGNFSLAADGSFSYAPAPDFNGSDSFTYHASDGSLSSGTATVTITVDPVNDAPSFVPGGSVSVNAADGAVSQAWATGMSAGPPDEAGQTLSFNTSVDLLGALLFSVQPSIAADGTLTFTPNGGTGTATVTVTIRDDGGTANGGVNTSAPQTFTITLN